MILRLTAKLGKKIGSMPRQALAPDENPFADWVGNLFTANRVQYIILSNTTSIYSVILFGRGITDDNAFLDHSLNAIKETLCDDGLEFIFSRLIVPHLHIIRYSKTGNPRALGSMNDLIYSAKRFLIERQMSPFETAHMINDTPLSYLQYNNPKACFTAMTPNDGNAGLRQFFEQQQQRRKEQTQNRREDNAMAKWQAIPQIDRDMIMKNVWCGGCRSTTTIVDYQVQSVRQDLVLNGYCAKCGREVARVVECD
jgi:hypothetical protein